MLYTVEAEIFVEDLISLFSFNEFKSMTNFEPKYS